MESASFGIKRNKLENSYFLQYKFQIKQQQQQQKVWLDAHMSYHVGKVIR